MAILKDILESNGNVDSFAEAAGQTDIPGNLYQKMLASRGDTELNEQEEQIITDIEDELAGVEPCQDCGHYFTEGEGFYHDEDGTLCESCFREKCLTDLNWYKHMLEVEEDLSKSEIAEMSDDEIEKETEELVGDGDYCYYGEV